MEAFLIRLYLLSAFTAGKLFGETILLEVSIRRGFGGSKWAN